MVCGFWWELHYTNIAIDLVFPVVFVIYLFIYFFFLFTYWDLGEQGEFFFFFWVFRQETELGLVAKQGRECFGDF